MNSKTVFLTFYCVFVSISLQVEEQGDDTEQEEVQTGAETVTGSRNELHRRGSLTWD